MYVIAGVTGKTGAVAARALLDQGKQVKVIVRDAARGAPWKAQGAQVAVADLADVGAVTRALEGATGAYLLSPPNMAAAGTARGYIEAGNRLIDGLAAAAKAAKLPTLVFLSSVGAHQPEGTGPVVSLHHGEDVLASAASSVTFLRAAYFMENWGSVLGAARADGVLPYFGPVNKAFGQVATPDIGAQAAKLLLEARPGTRAVELAGPTDYSVEDVAAALSTLLGKPVKAISAPVEAAEQGLTGAGLPPGMAALYAEMYAALAGTRMDYQRPADVVRGPTGLEAGLRPLLG